MHAFLNNREAIPIFRCHDSCIAMTLLIPFTIICLNGHSNQNILVFRQINDTIDVAHSAIQPRFKLLQSEDASILKNLMIQLMLLTLQLNQDSLEKIHPSSKLQAGETTTNEIVNTPAIKHTQHVQYCRAR